MTWPVPQQKIIGVKYLRGKLRVENEIFSRELMDMVIDTLMVAQKLVGPFLKNIAFIELFCL